MLKVKFLNRKAGSVTPIFLQIKEKKRYCMGEKCKLTNFNMFCFVFSKK